MATLKMVRKDEFTKEYHCEGTKYLPKCVFSGYRSWYCYVDGKIFWSPVAKYNRNLGQPDGSKVSDLKAWIDGYDAMYEKALAEETAKEEARNAAYQKWVDAKVSFNKSLCVHVDSPKLYNVGDVVSVEMGNVAKPNSYGDSFIKYVTERDYNPTYRAVGEVKHVKTVSNDEFDAFVQNTYNMCFDVVVGGNSDDNVEYVTLVSAPNRSSVVVNQQGYSYVRYVGVIV